MGSFKMKTVTLVDTWCGVCGIDFAMPDWLYKARRDDGQAFWCPRGCRIGYTESEADRLRRQVKAWNPGLFTWKTSGEPRRSRLPPTRVR